MCDKNGYDNGLHNVALFLQIQIQKGSSYHEGIIYVDINKQTWTQILA